MEDRGEGGRTELGAGVGEGGVGVVGEERSGGGGGGEGVEEDVKISFLSFSTRVKSESSGDIGSV